MASKWATEKAEAVNLDLNIGLYRDEVDAFAAALDAARQEGKREMRERAAKVASTVKFAAVGVCARREGEYARSAAAKAIRALPLEDR